MKELVCIARPFVVHGMSVNYSTSHILPFLYQGRRNSSRGTRLQTVFIKPHLRCRRYDGYPVKVPLDFPHVSSLLITPPRIRLQLVRPSATSLNVTLFPASNGGSLGPHILTSGPYSDAISGVATPLVSLAPGKYQLIPSTYKPGVQAPFRLIVYSTSAGVNITPRDSRTV